MFDYFKNIFKTMMEQGVHGTTVDKTLTASGMGFDIFVIVSTIVLLVVLSRIKKNFYGHYYSILVGVTIFEMFTSPLGNNQHFGKYSYFYLDNTGVLTMGGSTLILSVVLLVNYFKKELAERGKFAYYLLGMSFIGIVAEALVVKLDLRTYAPETINAMSGNTILGVPLEALFYIPVFTGLIIGFYKYWSFHLDGVLIVPFKKVRGFTSFIITLVTVLMFEYMVEPTAINHMPEWSYFYNDVSFIMTGIGIIIIGISIKSVDYFFRFGTILKKFFMYVLISGLISIGLESGYVLNGYREYSASATEAFAGIQTYFTNLPIEIIFAMPMYMALMISFIKYGEIIIYKKK